ncbi:MAG TPA: glyoxalase [Bacteroidia bacterium]|jgi:uncharacterized glyoxalase superfamily protein PhnB|nr:glyoxalase [Bacteroidia bacterium]
MESLSPNIFVKDINRTIEFDTNLGFRLEMTVPPAVESKPFDWAMLSCGKVTFMFQTFESLGKNLPDISRSPGGSLLLYIKVKGILELFKKMEGTPSLLTPLEKTFYGATEFSIKDCNGYVLTFAEDL